MKQTRALQKIAGLSKKIRGVQGGQGAGKTIAILMLIVNHCLSNPNKRVYIVSDELSKMKLGVIPDMLNILREFGIFHTTCWNKTESIYTLGNGSFIKFMGFDKDDIGKGVRSHIVFFNEANKIPFEGVMQFISRTQAVFIDFNPDHLFWFHKEIKTRDDCDYLELTYKDNEQLSASEVKEILLYKEKGYNPDGTIRNRYWANKWKVYGLGQVGMVDGVIFENWEEFNEYPDEEYTRLFGVDWGQVDPTSAVEVRFYPDMKIYLYEHFYKPIKELDPLLHKLRKTVTKDDVIIADSAGKDKILQLLQHGFNALKSDKSAITSNGSIMDGIDMMQNYHFYIHKDSTNAIAEFSNYRYKKDKMTGTTLPIPIDDWNHIIDPVRYCVRASHLYGY